MGDHAPELRKACSALLDENADSIGEILAGIHLAGRFTFSVPDMIRVGYTRTSACAFCGQRHTAREDHQTPILLVTGTERHQHFIDPQSFIGRHGRAPY